MKKLILKQRTDTPHWVGNGFPVRSVFNYMEHGKLMTPFLLMDYAGPTHFSPTTKRRGVGEHPHRGFETVTIVYSGEVEHRDSSGGGGIIKPGDVQWMSAASGVVHEEFHGKDFAEKGGDFEMIQLWVNLPAAFKMHSPRYQGLKNESIPHYQLGTKGSFLRVIAGSFEGVEGPAKTFSPINLWDLRVKARDTITLKVPADQTASLFVLNGEITSEDGNQLKNADWGLFQRNGDELTFTAMTDSKVLFMGGEPIEEPIVGYGPFVMNTREEIAQAFKDFESGKMGNLSTIEGAE